MAPTRAPLEYSDLPAEVVSLCAQACVNDTKFKIAGDFREVNRRTWEALTTVTYESAGWVVKRGDELASGQYDVFLGLGRADSVRFFNFFYNVATCKAPVLLRLIGRLRACAPRLVSIAVHIDGLRTLFLTRNFRLFGFHINGALESVMGMKWGWGAGMRKWSALTRQTLRVVADVQEGRQEEMELAVCLPSKHFQLFDINLVPPGRTSSRFPVDLAVQLCHAIHRSGHGTPYPTLQLRSWRNWKADGGDGVLELLEQVSEHFELSANIDIVYKKSPAVALTVNEALACADDIEPLYAGAIAHLGTATKPSIDIRVGSQATPDVRFTTLRMMQPAEDVVVAVSRRDGNATEVESERFQYTE